MVPPLDALASVTHMREAWRFKVRIIRLWLVPSYNNPHVLNSIEMVFMDEYDCKIQATVRKPLVYKFMPLLNEGRSYVMAYFGVVPNQGTHRPTRHEFRLIFQFRTTVKPCESQIIPLHGLTLSPFNDIIDADGESPFLVDVMGLLSRVSNEKEYEKDGKTTKMVVIELSFDVLKLECALFGEYAEEVNKFLGSENLNQPIVVVQFAKMKSFKGKMVIQNAMHVTRLMFNPEIAEAADFRNLLSDLKVDVSKPILALDEFRRYSLEDDFMRLTPRKTIEELLECNEGGCCIVLATVKNIIKDGEWWYPACKCNRAVTPDSGKYYCDGCICHVVNVFPRYRVKISVVDDTGIATFALFDRDVANLLKKTCTEMINEFQKVQATSSSNFPPQLDDWEGKKWLFKVETKGLSAPQYDSSYRVKRVADDENIITLFELDGSDITPKQAMFTPPFPEFYSIGADGYEVESMFGKIARDETSGVSGAIFSRDKLTPAKRKLHEGAEDRTGAGTSSVLLTVKEEK